MRGRAGATFVVAALLAQLCLAGDCVDGVTPDCSDAAAQCGPDLDGAVIDAAVVDAPVIDATEPPPNDSGEDADAGAGDQ